MGRSKGDRDAQIRHSHEWERRPGLSRALRIAVFAIPVAASFGVALLLGHLLPRAGSLPTHVLWVVVIAAASLLTLLAVERATRQLVPLAALLDLSLIFPDKAPARFAVARRTGRPRDLQASLQRAQDSGHEDDARRMQTVIELVLALSVHDRASRGHSERVRVFTDLLADELKIPESGRNRLRWAALLHDIGKLEVAPTILNKAAAPSEEEWAVLHRHPEEGARLVAPLLPWLGEWGLAVEQHHERFDGTGYPHRLRGQEISRAARIVAVADSYEVMTAPRAYKRPMSVSAARQELVRVAGSQLDPVVVRAFLNISVGRLWRTIGFGAWIGQIPTVARLLSFGGWASSAIAVATATTATVLAVAGVAGPAPSPPSPGPSSPAVALAPVHSPQPADPAIRPGMASPTPPHAQTPTPAGARAVTTPTPQPAPAPTHTPTATPTPKPTPPPTATPAPTPVPTPDPWSCAGCTNSSPTCTSYCNGSKKTDCVTYCIGSNNKLCISHCFGSNNKSCISYCQGTGNPACLTYCRAVVQAAWLTVARQPVAPLWALRQAEAMLNATMTTTSALVMRPLY
jgi:HD domain